MGNRSPVNAADRTEIHFQLRAHYALKDICGGDRFSDDLLEVVGAVIAHQEYGHHVAIQFIKDSIDGLIQRGFTAEQINRGSKELALTLHPKFPNI